jgi:multidrug resistance efflux pump
MNIVEDDMIVIALFSQNELTQVKPGDEAEIVLKTLPGEIIKAKVDSIVWAHGQGQVANTTQIPTLVNAPPANFPVKLVVDPKYRNVFLAAGARGTAAIYTEHLTFLHILRRVFLRVGTKVNYLVLKLH